MVFCPWCSLWWIKLFKLELLVANSFSLLLVKLEVHYLTLVG